MKRKQVTEERILGLLKAGAVVTGLCRKRGMSSATYRAWEATFGGREISDAKRLREPGANGCWRTRCRISRVQGTDR